jgi:uncharacterized protein
VELTRYQNIHAFNTATEAFLVEREAENNLLLGISHDIAQGKLYADIEPYLATVTDGGRIVAAALRTPPHNLHISCAAQEALELIATDAVSLYPDLPGVQGPKDTAKIFAEMWTEFTGSPARLGFAQRIYQLDEVTPTPSVQGKLRAISRDDIDLAVKWWLGFEAEAYGLHNLELAERSIRARLESETRGLFLWQDQVPVAMAGYSGSTPNGMRVGPVYTPPGFRRRGYGTAATAALSQLLLDRGRRYCFLFTDLSNPTSNSIYQRIGYQPIVDVDEYRFG